MGLRHHLPRSTYISRRDFVRWCGLPLAGMTTGAPAALLRAFPAKEPFGGCAEPVGAEYRLTPHYRAQSPFDEVIRQTEPGHDAICQSCMRRRSAPFWRDGAWLCNRIHAMLDRLWRPFRPDSWRLLCNHGLRCACAMTPACRCGGGVS